ncbi:hypothetical protein UFOVP32_13 [uncultured Caudovirales phage]|uniref:Uncharacterized protein n=1 Tax=uncultured Caudovirales phage TaxID=2100421 RepID=A0A6J5KPI4_9CAUD|nr:hypothetical protein UFOVP32_13 [uncultured Caudovirales phage]CAB4123791.1 hypothetical protein UFOVP50_63 [uncultured Caudovirales phage]
MNFDLPGMDTKTLSEEGVPMIVKKINSDMPLLDKNGDPVTITVLGPDSIKYRSLSRAQVRKRVQRAAAGNMEVNFEEDEGDALDILVACTIAWTGVNTPAGDAIPCTPEAVRNLYTVYPVIRDQVDLFSAQRVNFTKAS